MQLALGVTSRKSNPCRRTRAAAFSLAFAAVAAFVPAEPTDAFSSGSVVCEVNTIPFAPMSSVVSNPIPVGWSLRAGASVYVPGQSLTLELVNSDPGKRLRGVLIWAKSGPFTGAGSFQPSFPSALFRYVEGAMPDCGESSLTHANANPKAQDQLRFSWQAPVAGTGSVIVRAYLIEDCGAGQSCRSAQALTDILVLEEAVFSDGFE
jgi:hypothetical protein